MRIAGVAIALIAVAVAPACLARKPGPLRPDMSLRVDCSQQPSNQKLLNLKRAIFEAGFDVLDKVQLAKEARTAYPFTLRVDAIDKAGRYISILAIQTTDDPRSQANEPFEISVGLYSEPPTKRDQGLEQLIQSLVTSGLGCSEVTIERHENSLDAKAIYTLTSGYVRDWVKQAREMHASTDALLVR